MAKQIVAQPVLDLGELIRQAQQVNDIYGGIETRAQGLRKVDPFKEGARSVLDFNQRLGQQVQVYQRVQATQESLRKELGRMEAEYQQLNARKKEFADAGRYQELQARLQSIRDRSREISTALGQADEGVKKVDKSAGAASATFNKVRDYVVGAFAVDKVLEFGTEVIGISGKFEKFEAVLTNTLGSRSAARAALQQITDFAASTPFGVDEITDSFVKLANRGIIPTKEQLTNIGDIAASQGKSLDQFVEALLDAQGGEFERLKEFGIKASKAGDQVTLSFKGVNQVVKNTPDAINAAVLGFGKLAGVAGGMSAIAQTQEGLVSNLGDSYDQLEIAIGERGVSGGFKLAVGAAGKFLGVLTDLIKTSPADSLREQQAELNGLVGAIVLANDNEAVRLDLITQLNQKYPEFLGKLDAESASNDILIERLKTVNQLYEQKIRIALGEEKIKKASEDLTASIRRQSDALQDLARVSGKSITDLEKLTPKQQVALARQIGSKQSQVQVMPGVGMAPSASTTDLTANDLENGAKQQVKAQAELNKLLGENAIRQTRLTDTTVKGYQVQIKQIQEKIRLNKIDRSQGEAEVKRLQAEINKAKGIAVKPVATPTATTTTKKVDPIKAAQDENKLLLDAKEDYEKEVKQLESQYGKDRLERLKKDSAEYINAKAQFEAEELKIQRDAIEKRLQLAMSEKTRVNKQTGKREVVADTSVTLEKDAPEVARIFAERQQQIETERARQLQLSSVRQEYQLLELAKQSADNELAIFDKYWEEKLLSEKDHSATLASLELQRDAARKIVAATGNKAELIAFDNAWAEIIANEKQNGAVYLALVAKRNRDRNTLVTNQILETSKKQEDISLAFIDTDRFAKIKQTEDPTLNAEKLETVKQQARYEVLIRAGEARKKLLKEQGEEENAVLITQTEAAIDKLKKEQQRLTDSTPKFTDIYDLLGITDGMDQTQLDAFKQGLQQIGDSIRQVTAIIVEQSEEKIRALDNEISAKEEQVRIEQERDNEGYANNLAIRKKELEDLKAQKAEEQETRRKALKIQQGLDAASTLSNTAVAVSNGITFLTGLAAQMTKLGPIAGPIAFFGTLAAMTAAIFASVASIKALAKGSTQLRNGGRMPLNGRTHEQGGHRIEGTDIEVEAREHVVNARSSDTFDKTITALNNNDPHEALRQLVREGSLSMPDAVVVQQKRPNMGIVIQPAPVDLSPLKAELAAMREEMKAISKNTEPRPTFGSMPDGSTIEIEPDGRRVTHSPKKGR